MKRISCLFRGFCKTRRTARRAVVFPSFLLFAATYCSAQPRTNVVEAAIQRWIAERQAAQPAAASPAASPPSQQTGQFSPMGAGGGGGLTPGLTNGCATGGCATGGPAYLTNLYVTGLTTQFCSVTLWIAGGTNGVLYNILGTNSLNGVNGTNSPFWLWVGAGYTCGSYTFTNQSPSSAFYRLDSSLADDDYGTMAVAWGDGSAGQCSVPSNLREVVAAAGGLSHSVALQSYGGPGVQGVVVGWGDNTYGQTNVPAGLSNVLAIAAGAYHNLALRCDGSVTNWGAWYNNLSHPTATLTASLTNVVGISAGADHDIAVKADGTVVVWGYTNEIYDTQPAGLSGVQAVAAGWNHNVALLSGGTIVAWGMNYAGFGWNVTNVPAGLSNVTAIAAGGHHTLALRGDGTVAAWGAGNSTNGVEFADKGQSIVPAGLSNVIAIAAGGYHSLALRSDGTAVAWGDVGPPVFPLAGIAGIGGGGNHDLAIRAGLLAPIISQQPVDQIAPAGTNATFAAQGIGLDEVYYQWQFNGVNIAGATNTTLTLINVQAANQGTYDVIVFNDAGSVTSSIATFSLLPAPQIVSTTPPAPSTNWITNSFTLAVNATAMQTNLYRIYYQWLQNGAAIAGATNASLTLNPQSSFPWQTNAVDGSYTVNVWNVSGTNQAGAWTIAFLFVPQPGMTDAWGSDDDGESEFPGDLTNALAIAAGEFHSVAVRDDGSVVQWGYDWASVPANLTNAVSVSAGYSHTLALASDGTVVSWGSPTNPANTVPTNLAGAKDVAAGWNHNVALLTNGTVTAWGIDGADLGWHLTEVPADLTNVTAIAAGALHSLALRADGTVEGWGYSPDGETNVLSGLSNVVAIAAGGQHSLALRVDGTVVAWGNNSSGQCSAPSGLSNVMAVAAGWAHSLALKNDGTLVAWGDNSDGQTNLPAGLTNATVKLIAAGGDHSLAAVFSPLVQYPVDVTKDLLLVYNTYSVDSSNVWAFYMQHRPMVGAANVLPIGCAPQFNVNRQDFTNTIRIPMLGWLGANPTKRPQYWILFLDVPSRINAVTNAGVYASPFDNSVSFELYSTMPNAPFVTHINMRDNDPSQSNTAACLAYIDKLE